MSAYLFGGGSKQHAFIPPKMRVTTKQYGIVGWSRASTVHKSVEEDRPQPHRAHYPNHLVNEKINMFNITYTMLGFGVAEMVVQPRRHKRRRIMFILCTYIITVERESE